MIGAIAGDIIGSVYEQHPIKNKDFPLFHPRCVFTDDTVLTVAIAEAILTGTPHVDAVRQVGNRSPRAGYGKAFTRWRRTPNAAPYNSWGNGSAMRVSPVGFAFSTQAEVLAQAEATAVITHNHPEGVKGAQATALAVFLARIGTDKETIRARLADRFHYDHSRTIDDIRPGYRFDVSCQGPVPEAILAFLDADSYEDTVRNTVSLGGDSDTLGCLAGGIAEAFHGCVPDPVRAKVQEVLPPDLWSITKAFCATYQ